MAKLHSSGLFYVSIEGLKNPFGFYHVMADNQSVGYIPFTGPGDILETLQLLNSEGFAIPVKMGSYGFYEHCLQIQHNYKPNGAIIMPKFQGDNLLYFVLQNPPQMLDETSRLIIDVFVDKKGPMVVDGEFVYDSV